MEDTTITLKHQMFII